MLQMCASTTFLSDGAVYDLTTDTWRTMSAPPSSPAIPPYGYASVATSDSLFIWGGNSYERTAVEYFPATDSWRVPVIAPIGRQSAKAAFDATSQRVLFWGGTASGGTPQLDGIIYDRSGDTWLTIPTAPITTRNLPVMLWTGTSLVVFGGYDSTGKYVSDGAAYDPISKTWTSIPSSGVPYADVLAVAGDFFAIDASDPSKTPLSWIAGARLDLAATTWSTVPAPATSILTPRAFAQAWVGAGKIWIWSGDDLVTGDVAGGASFDPGTNTYTSFADPGLLSPRTGAFTGWTGKSGLIWGGHSGLSATSCLNDGAIFTP